MRLIFCQANVKYKSYGVLTNEHPGGIVAAADIFPVPNDIRITYKKPFSTKHSLM